MQKLESCNRVYLSLSLALLLAVSSQCVANASDVSLGLKYYNQGKYELARNALQQSIKSNKEDPRLHYCLANTFLRLNKIPEAMREYHLVIHYGTGTIIAEEAEGAIKTYEQHARPFDREKALEAQKEAQAKRDEELKQQAAEVIHRQSQTHSGLRTSEVEGQKNIIIQRASENAKRLRDSAEEDAQAAANSYYRRNRSWARRNADDIRRQAEEDSQALVKRAQQQAENYERDARERQSRMAEAESNLNDQMLRPIGGGKMKLVPEGTNLYIRNYR